MSRVRDPALADAGQRKIAWAQDHMPVLDRVEAELADAGTLKGVPIGICLHLEAKTARLALALQRAGAQVAITGSNPLSVQDDVAAGLAADGVTVHSWHGMTPAEYTDCVDAVLDATLAEPEASRAVYIDDGGDLTLRLHDTRAAAVERVAGVCEETTTGVARLRALHVAGRLRLPVVAVNDARSKYLYDNRYGTGQSVWDGFMRTTNLTVAGKCVWVVGYGWCGKGIAARARGLGARVVVSEIDPFAANEALMEGFEVLPGEDAAAKADVVVTATGVAGAVRAEHLERLPDGAVLANAGHFDVEVSLPDLAAAAVAQEQARAGVTRYRLRDGRRLYLLARGALVNLAAGDGHPAEIMDLSFGLQALTAAGFAAGALPTAAGVHPVPEEIDRRVAALRLAALGVGLDVLTAEQEQYRQSWEAGFVTLPGDGADP